MADEHVVGLAETIEALREELYQADALGARSELRFGLKPVTLTVQTVVRQEGGVKGKLRWFLFDAEAEGKVASEATQTLQLELEPLRLGPGGKLEPVDVSRERREEKAD